MKLSIRIHPAEDEALGGYVQRLADSNDAHCSHYILISSLTVKKP